MGKLHQQEAGSRVETPRSAAALETALGRLFGQCCSVAHHARGPPRKNPQQNCSRAWGPNGHSGETGSLAASDPCPIKEIKTARAVRVHVDVEPSVPGLDLRIVDVIRIAQAVDLA